MKRMMQKIRMRILWMILVIGVCAVRAGAAAPEEFLDLPLTDAPGVVTQLVDVDGQIHRLEGALDLAALEQHPAAMEIRSYELWYGEQLLLSSQLHLEEEVSLLEDGTPAMLNGYYTAEFMMDEIHQVFLTGLTQNTLAQVQEELVASVLDGSEFTMTNVDFIDTEKEIIIETELGETEGDAQMCWAAATSNILHYTGWGQAAGFEDEDELFETFIEYFDDHGGQYVYGLDWFFNGINAKQSTDGWAHVEKDYGTFLGYLPEYSANAFYSHIQVNKYPQNMAMVMEKLREGYGIGVSFGFYLSWLRQGGHAVTLWGYIRDITQNSWSKQAYTALFLSDSDSDKVQYQPRRSAPDNLTLMPLTPFVNLNLDSWLLDGYTDWFYDAVLEGFTVLAPYSAQPEMSGSKNRFTHPDLVLEDLRVSSSSIQAANLNLTTYGETDDLTLKFIIENAGLQTGWKDVQVALTLWKDGTIVREKTTSQELLFGSQGSVNGSLHIGSLESGSYEVLLEVDFVDSIPEAFEDNNTLSGTFRIAESTCDSSGVSISAVMGDMDGETGGDAQITVSGLETVEGYLGKGSFVLFQSYYLAGWSNWSPTISSSALPNTCPVPAIGRQVKFMLMMLPEDETKTALFAYSNPVDLVYYRLNLYTNSDNGDVVAKLTPGTTALPDGEQFSVNVSYSSVNWEELTYTLSLYAERTSNKEQIPLFRTDTCTIGASGGNVDYRISSWETPLDSGIYEIYARVESNLGTITKRVSRVIVYYEERSVVCDLTKNEPSSLGFKITGFGVDGSETAYVEYGFVDQEETEIEKALLFYLSDRELNIGTATTVQNVFPQSEYRYRAILETENKTVYSEWKTVTTEPILSAELKLNQMGEIYVDQELEDYLFFHYPVTKTGTYLLKAPDCGSTATFQYALQSKRKWEFGDSIRSDVGGSKALELEAGDMLYIRLNTFGGGGFSIGIFEPSLQEIQDLRLIRLTMNRRKAEMGITAKVPFNWTISAGVEYGLTQTDTVKVYLYRNYVVKPEFIFNMAYLEVPLNREMWFRAFLIDETTGETYETQWQSLHTGTAGFKPVTKEQPGQVQISEEDQYFCYTAQESGWYTLQIDTNCIGYLYVIDRDDGQPWQWMGQGALDPTKPETLTMSRYLSAGETDAFRIYTRAENPKITLSITENTVTAYRREDSIAVEYRPDVTGMHVVGLYDGQGKLLEARQLNITDVKLVQKQTFLQSDAAEVRVFQLNGECLPQKSVLWTMVEDDRYG